MKTFIKAALIRAIKTVCQTAVATIGTAFVISDVNWLIVVSASLLAGILSILTSIATGLPEVDYYIDEDDYEEYVEEEEEEEEEEEDERA